MKNIFRTILCSAALFTSVQCHAQTTGQKIKHDAKKVGDKTSEIAAKGASAVVDKKYEGKVGPEGQTIYINKYSHYYYIDKKGHRVYLKKSELKNK